MLKRSNLVVLRGGVSVTEEAYRLACRLTDRGLTLLHQGEHLLVQPADLLTENDRRDIRAMKPHLCVLADYVAPEIAQ